MVSSLSSCTSSGDWSIFLKFSEEQTSPSTGLVSGNHKLVWRMYTTIKDAAIKMKQCLNQHSSSVLAINLLSFAITFPDQCPFLSMADNFHPLTLRLSTFQGNWVPSLRWTISDLKNFSSTLQTSSFNLSYNMCSIDFFASTWPLDRGSGATPWNQSDPVYLKTVILLLANTYWQSYWCYSYKDNIVTFLFTQMSPIAEFDVYTIYSTLPWIQQFMKENMHLRY